MLKVYIMGSLATLGKIVLFKALAISKITNPAFLTKVLKKI